MSFIQGIDFIADTEECRRLARKVPNVSFDFIDDQIKSWQKKHYSRIRTLTDKDDWDSDDREFSALQAIEIELTAASIIKHYGDVSTIEIWKAMNDSAIYDLCDKENGIISNMDTAVAEEDVAEVDRTEFKSWGKNPLLEPPDDLVNLTGDDGETL